MAKTFREVLGIFSTANLPADLPNQPISFITCDSRAVIPGSLFVALKGELVDGRKFIPQAVSKGAALVVAQSDGEVAGNDLTVPFLVVENAEEFLRQSLVRFYDNPSAVVRLIGVTGTNGKTTITYLLESIFHCAHKKSGVVGTVNSRLDGQVYPAKNTTPGIVDNFRFLDQCRSKQADYCVMEVSSHALAQRRVAGLDFAAAVFTNLTGDHLDYHKDMEQYFQAKAKLFTSLKKSTSFAVINVDDIYGQRLAQMSSAPVLTYSIDSQADLRAEEINLNLDGTSFQVASPAGRFSLTTELIGKHNIYNILAAVGVALKEKIPIDQIQKGIRALNYVPGRLEKVSGAKGVHVFIDYAHTHDALENVLSILKQLKQGRLIVVFGCGGDRDKTKRPKMGEVASRLADFMIVTNDNPRSEDPDEIIQQIVSGLNSSRYKVITDRKTAIAEALNSANAGDIVLVAGKGHENYQIFKDQTIDFNEGQIIRELLGGM